jgi:hypothetical protein
MKCLCRYVRAALVAGLLAGGLCFAGAETPTGGPRLSGEEIMRRAVERVESPARSTNRPDYEYQKHTVREDLDKKGRLREHKEKLYNVEVHSGLSLLKLVEIDGQHLAGAELAKQQERDTAERAKWVDAKPDKRGDNRENFLTMDLVGRYKFTVADKKMLKGRMTYVLNFEPKSANLPIKKLPDRLVNHIAGKVWVDAEDFEIARADVHLQAEVEMWGGIIGTLRRCDFSFFRSRMDDGVWFNSFSHGVFEGRKLLEPFLIKYMSESSDFRRLALAKN